MKFDIINHHFMHKFVDSGLYFVQDENNFINPLLQIGSGSVEKSTGSGGPKITGSDRIRILIPVIKTKNVISVKTYTIFLLGEKTFLFPPRLKA